MSKSTLSFIHQHETGDGLEPPVLLLHGTGGNESSLLSFGRSVAPGHALLSPRGKVLEYDQPRFFRRFAEGVFDEADVRFRAHELADFIAEACSAYGMKPPLAIGFSNGANIAAAMLFLRPEVLCGAVLLRAMMPLVDPPTSDLSGLPVLIVSADDDPIVPDADRIRLGERLQRCRADVESIVLPDSGHNLADGDRETVAAWMSKIGTRSA